LVLGDSLIDQWIEKGKSDETKTHKLFLPFEFRFSSLEFKVEVKDEQQNIIIQGMIPFEHLFLQKGKF